MSYNFKLLLPACVMVLGCQYVYADSFNETTKDSVKNSDNSETLDEYQQESPHHLVTTLGLYTDYIFRGMSYGRRRGVAQAYIDYSHDSGIYLGTGITNLHKDSVYGNTVEVDVYGGISKSITEKLIGSIGLFQWIFPQNEKVADQTAFVTEVHMVLEYKPFTMKFAYSLTDWFGINTKSFGNTQFGNHVTGTGDTKGTNYIEINYNNPLPYYGLNLYLHAGYQTVKNYAIGNYTDIGIGINKDFNIDENRKISVGVNYITTDANTDWYSDASGYKMGNSKFLGFIRYTF